MFKNLMYLSLQTKIKYFQTQYVIHMKTQFNQCSDNQKKLRTTLSLHNISGFVFVLTHIVYVILFIALTNIKHYCFFEHNMIITFNSNCLNIYNVGGFVLLLLYLLVSYSYLAFLDKEIRGKYFMLITLLIILENNLLFWYDVFTNFVIYIVMD